MLSNYCNIANEYGIKIGGVNKLITSLRNKSKYVVHQGRQHRGGGRGAMALTFLHSKKKIGKQREKRNNFKAETIKRLSPRSKCYCFSHSRLFRIQKIFFLANHGGRQYFPLFHGPSPLKFISPAFFTIEIFSCIYH